MQLLQKKKEKKKRKGIVVVVDFFFPSPLIRPLTPPPRYQADDAERVLGVGVVEGSCERESSCSCSLSSSSPGGLSCASYMPSRLIWRRRGLALTLPSSLA